MSRAGARERAANAISRSEIFTSDTPSAVPSPSIMRQTRPLALSATSNAASDSRNSTRSASFSIAAANAPPARMAIDNAAARH